MFIVFLINKKRSIKYFYPVKFKMNNEYVMLVIIWWEITSVIQIEAYKAE